jgi:hypothetical protein
MAHAHLHPRDALARGVTESDLALAQRIDEIVAAALG